MGWALPEMSSQDEPLKLCSRSLTGPRNWYAGWALNEVKFSCEVLYLILQHRY